MIDLIIFIYLSLMFTREKRLVCAILVGSGWIEAAGVGSVCVHVCPSRVA
jgi:hypothetical protein